MHRRQFLTSSSAAAVSLAFPYVHAQSSARLTPLRFTLDFRITGQTSPFFMAHQKGYYRNEGLNVTIDVGAGSVASITRIATGAYQMGLGDISSLIEFQSANPPLVQAVYQYYNRAPFAIIGRKDRGITEDFMSLQGKRVAAAAVESTRRAWPMVANRLGQGTDFFQWITTEFSARDNVMVRGDVDAATYFHDSAVSLFARMNPADLSGLRYTDAGVNLYGNAILASQDMISQQPEVVAAFLRATNRAIVETLTDPMPAIAATKAREPIIDERLELERWKLTAEYVAASDIRTHGLGDIVPATLAQQMDQVVEVFGLSNRPSADGVFVRNLLPAAADRQVVA